MEKNRSSFTNSQISGFESNTNHEFHYSIHENSVLFNSKKQKKLMNKKIQVQSNCAGCINPSPNSKSPSILKKFSSLFCCYVPSAKKMERVKIIEDGIQQKKHESSSNTINSVVNDSSNEKTEEILIKEVPPIELSAGKTLGNEINWFDESKKQSPSSKMMKCKSGSGSMQAKCPFTRKHYVSSRLGDYPENQLFFWKHHEHFVIARIKINDFYHEENTQETDDKDKNKTMVKLSFNSVVQKESKHFFKEHLCSLDVINPVHKYSIINLAEETKHENKENLTYDERLRRPKNPFFSKSPNIFDKKIKIDSESWEYTIPDRISTYLAKRCRNYGGETVLDAFCGIGMNAINFYQEDFKVIAMDSRVIDPNRRRIATVDYAQYNAALHGINNGINFIKGEFLDINFNKMMLDVILINPVLKYSPEKKFSLIRNGGFDYLSVLKKAISMVGNVVLCLPRNVDILEIVELFSMVCNENEDMDANCIEVEFQFMSKELQQIVVFYGPVAGISRKELLDFLLNTVNQDNKTCKLKQNNFIQSIFSRIGIKAAAKYIVSAEKKQVKSETILQRFIDLVKINRELSVEDLDDCRKETINEAKSDSFITKGDISLREQFLMLNVNEDGKEKKKYQTKRHASNSNMFEINYDNYLEPPRNKVLKAQEQISDTPVYSYYSGKLMSSASHHETLNCSSMKEKEFIKDFNVEYSFQKGGYFSDSPPIQEKKHEHEKKNQDLEFWGDTNYEMGFINHLKNKKKDHEGNFTEFKCRVYDFV